MKLELEDSDVERIARAVAAKLGGGRRTDFGFDAAGIGRTVYVNTECLFGELVTDPKGIITNIARDADGNVAVIYATVAGHTVVLTSESVLTVV